MGRVVVKHLEKCFLFFVNKIVQKFCFENSVLCYCAEILYSTEQLRAGGEVTRERYCLGRAERGYFDRTSGRSGPFRGKNNI